MYVGLLEHPIILGLERASSYDQTLSCTDEGCEGKLQWTTGEGKNYAFTIHLVPTYLNLIDSRIYHVITL